MLTHNRENNIELVGLERPRHSLVLKADFADLEIRKQKAASAWLREYNKEYKHEMSMPEKKALWEMQRQDAAKARQDAEYAAFRRFEDAASDGRISDVSNIRRLTKCLIQGIDCSPHLKGHALTVQSSSNRGTAEKRRDSGKPGTEPGSPVLTKRESLNKSFGFTRKSTKDTEQTFIAGRGSEPRQHTTPVGGKVVNSSTASISFDQFLSSSQGAPPQVYKGYEPVARISAKKETAVKSPTKVSSPVKALKTPQIQLRIKTGTKPYSPVKSKPAAV